MKNIDSKKLETAVEMSQKTGKQLPYLQLVIGLIATRYSVFGRWNDKKHDPYRQEMVSNAIAAMDEHWQHYRAGRSTIAFRYLATVTCVAFIDTVREYNPNFKL